MLDSIQLEDGTYAPDFSKYVAKGARVLDLIDPTWYTTIDLTTLDLGSTYTCILGQMFTLRNVTPKLNAFLDSIEKAHGRRVNGVTIQRGHHYMAGSKMFHHLAKCEICARCLDPELIALIKSAQDPEETWASELPAHLGFDLSRSYLYSWLDQQDDKTRAARSCTMGYMDIPQFWERLAYEWIYEIDIRQAADEVIKLEMSVDLDKLLERANAPVAA